MVRDRLHELHTTSKHTPATEEEEMKPLKNQVNDAEEFFLKLEEVSRNIDQVKKNADELTKIWRTILTATHREEKREQRADDLSDENKKLANSIRIIIKQEQTNLETMMAASPKKHTDKYRLDLRMRRTQVAAQSKRFFEAWNDYNQSQVDFRDKSKKLLVKRCKITNSSYSDDQIETMLDEGNTAVFAKSILDEERLARQQLSELQDRHDEFIKLEKSIKEVHDMFIEIAALVEEQGEVMDNIARHVEDAKQDVEQGKEHLGKAKDNQKKARKKKICLFTTLAVVIIIVVLVILAEFGLFSGGGDGGETKIIEKIVYVTQTTTTTTTTTTTSPLVVGDGATPAP